MNSSDHLSLKHAVFAVFLSVMTILYGTLLPMQFNFAENRVFDWKMSFAVQARDWVGNIFFFMPLGFSLMWAVAKLGRRSRIFLVLITLFGAVFSFTVEYLQLFLPTRGSSLRDIIANTLGTALGSALLIWRGDWILHQLSRFRTFAYQLNPLVWGILLVCYLGIVISGAVYLRNQAKLSGWRDDYFLLLGNEHTGGRAWRGSVTEFHIWNRTLSPDEIADALKRQTPRLDQSLIASYLLTKSLQDRSMNLPNLCWKGEPDAAVKDGLKLGDRHWLESENGAAALAQKLKETNQFTISLDLTSGSLVQYGPARILSFSADPGYRNFMVGQAGPDLILRLRTPVTGENGRSPQLNAENVLVDSNPHQIVITYDGQVVRLYIDNLSRAYHYDLGPESLLFRRFAPMEEEHFLPDANSLSLQRPACYLFLSFPLLILSYLFARTRLFNKARH